jgi:hypothetical protein
MEIEVRRHPSVYNATLGDLLIDGEFECYTLEDEVRHGPKVYGRTAIPAGRYHVTIDLSTRFKKRMPLLLDVPEFEGVRIHSGNTAADTLGCILVGRRIGPNGTIEESRLAFTPLFQKMDQAFARGEGIYITIKDAEDKANAA